MATYRIYKRLDKTVQIVSIESGQVLSTLQEEATLSLSSRGRGGVYVVDRLANSFQLLLDQVAETQIEPAAALIFKSSAADLYKLLESDFFDTLGVPAPPAPQTIHHADFYLGSPSAPITSFPASLALDTVRNSSGCFVLNANGAPVCQIAGLYKIYISVSLVGTEIFFSRSQFEGIGRLNGVLIPGTHQFIYVRREEYGGTASASFILDLEVDDVIDAQMDRNVGTEQPTVEMAQFVAVALTTTPT